MPLSKLIFKPGVNRDQTTTSGENGWYASDLIRFRSGFPEKLGGWTNVYNTPVLGTCRQMFNYVTSLSDNLVFLGTNEKVYVDFGSRLYDITPLRDIFLPPTTNNCFTTGAPATNIVTVTINNHGAENGNYVQFLGVLGFDGIPATDFVGVTFEISNVTTNTFTITTATNCTHGSVTGGGTAITAAFDIYTGPVVTINLIGWGTNTWGFGTWSQASTGINAIELQRDWWFDNFNDNVIMNYRNGAIYLWDYTLNFEFNRATSLFLLAPDGAVPVSAMQTLVSQSDGHVLAFGCTPYDPLTGTQGNFDPLLIRWSDQDDPFNWIPNPENSAGDLRLNGGSRIVRALRTRQEILVWTENSLTSIQFTGTSLVFSQQALANDISIMGCRAVTSVNDVVYWMGKDRFYVYSGRVETLPCTLRNHVYKDFNYEQFDQVIAGTNEGYNEVWWFYPTADSNTNNAYVIYNYLEKIWYYGYLPRTAWMDSPLRNYPMAAYEAGQKIYYHEDGCNNDGAAFSAFIRSNDFDLDDGYKLVLTKRIIPDLSFVGSTAANPVAYMTLLPRNFPGSPYQAEPEEAIVSTTTYPIDQFTDQVFIRVRARQMSFKISSDGLGVQWQLGAPRLDSKPDGRR